MKRFVVGMVLGIIIATGIGVVAFNIDADQVSYDSNTTVKDKIDDLYDKSANIFKRIGSGSQTFASAQTTPVKMNITLDDDVYMSNTGNVLKVKEKGKYLIVYAVGGNTRVSTSTACSNSGYLKIYVNDNLVASGREACTFMTGEYNADLNIDDEVYINIHGDGGEYSKKASAYIYKIG